MTARSLAFMWLLATIILTKQTKGYAGWLGVQFQESLLHRTLARARLFAANLRFGAFEIACCCLVPHARK
jgi:hypothetical protein